MDLYIIRHAVAYDRDDALWPDDRVRPLTPEGEKRWKKSANGLKQVAKDVQATLSSRLVRAWDTAVYLEKNTGWPAPVPCEALEPGHSPEEVLEVLREQGGSNAVALVGHEPDLHELIAYLLSGDADRITIDLQKGACVHLSLMGGIEPGGATLHSILTPKSLRALGG